MPSLCKIIECFWVSISPTTSCVCFCFRWIVRTDTTTYRVQTDPIPTSWFHVVVVFHGPSVGISVYIDGNLYLSDLSGTRGTYGFSSGHVVLGRSYTQGDWNYGRSSLDELYFWTQPLSDPEIENLFDEYP